jgi:Tfp pilus assembly protein PilF
MDIGKILVNRKQYSDALVVLSQAVKLDPSQPDAHFRMGHVYQLMGNEPQAEKEFAAVRELKAKQDEDKLRQNSSPTSP